MTFDRILLVRYDRPGPRYTSYPTAAQFHEAFGIREYLSAAAKSNDEPPRRPLSLYVHIPFCRRVCYYCACNRIITANRSKADMYLARLYREISIQAGLFNPDRKVDQLHWGGGTPTFSHQSRCGN